MYITVDTDQLDSISVQNLVDQNIQGYPVATSRKTAKVSKSNNPNGRPREYSEELLIYAAIRVMIRDGHRALTVRSLAAELGISHGALYTYIGSVRELEEKAKRHLASQLPTPQSASKPELRQEFIAYLRALEQIFLAHPGTIFVFDTSGAANVFERIGEEWKRALLPYAPDSETLDVALSALVGAVLLLVEAERMLISGHPRMNQRPSRNKSLTPAPSSEEVERYLDKLLHVVMPGLSSSDSGKKAIRRGSKK